MCIDCLLQVRVASVSWCQEILTFLESEKNILKISLRTTYARTPPPWTSKREEGPLCRALSFPVILTSNWVNSCLFIKSIHLKVHALYELFFSIGS